ncbi:hypothetical protein EIP86_002875 [Pleurotus ostreatoroseus]|nr:hypothetical protein EIP86_002875 [Pleurotus ostreatoroseus]
MARFSFLLLAAVVPFALAHNGGSNLPRSDADCNESEFFFEQKSCCLPYGGVPNPPTPPSGVTCPVSGWYWHNTKQCCVPHQPTQPSSPSPQCDKDCFWSKLDLKCYPGGSTSTTPSTPKPSGNANNHYRRRDDHKSRSAPLCPNAMEACPIKGLMGTSGDYECLDTKTELESCGGCASTGAGQDCTAIEGAWNVACNQGSCAVYTCQQGYKVARDGKSCTKL